MPVITVVPVIVIATHTIILVMVFVVMPLLLVVMPLLLVVMPLLLLMVTIVMVASISIPVFCLNRETRGHGNSKYQDESDAGHVVAPF